MDAIDRFGEALVQAGAAPQRPAGGRWRRALGTRSRSVATARSAQLRVALVVLALVLADRRDRARGDRSDPHGLAGRHGRASVATAGEGIPAPGGSRLLLCERPTRRAACRGACAIIHTTRGLDLRADRPDRRRPARTARHRRRVHDDGRFHVLPADALPDLADAAGWISFETARGRETSMRPTASGLQLSAATQPPPRALAWPPTAARSPSGYSECTP